MTDHDAARLTHSPLLDKENASNLYVRGKARSEAKKASLQQPKTPVRTTPIRRQPLQSASSTRTPAPRTPPVSSKVLRRHFAQLSITPQRTKIQSGAVRVQSKKKTPAVPEIRSPSRIGYDGTTKTPSKELLRSTACTRAHQVPHHRVSHNVLHEHDNDSLLTLDLVRCQSREQCCDPVALILLNDGKEDLERLLEQDSASPQTIQKVSSSLSDVMDDDEVATLVRPVPKMARP